MSWGWGVPQGLLCLQNNIRVMPGTAAISHCRGQSGHWGARGSSEDVSYFQTVPGSSHGSYSPRTPAHKHTHSSPLHLTGHCEEMLSLGQPVCSSIASCICTNLGDQVMLGCSHININNHIKISTKLRMICSSKGAIPIPAPSPLTRSWFLSCFPAPSQLAPVLPDPKCWDTCPVSGGCRQFSFTAHEGNGRSRGKNNPYRD